MVSIFMESLNPQFSNNLIGQNYEIALNNQIQAVLDSLHEQDSVKLSSLSSNFNELLQCRVDPPFEAIWVYSALLYRGFSLPENDPLKRVAAIKDLFQVIACCSALCDPFKSVALISPVMYNVVRLAMGLKGFDQKGKKEKKFVREVNGLVDSILGYVNVCCESVENSCDVSEGFVRPVRELVNVWMWDNTDNGCTRDFFPLLSDEIVEKVNGEGCELSELAGCVIVEAFLLKLCLRFLEEGSRKELHDELRAWIVASITGLQNPYFFVAELLGEWCGITVVLCETLSPLHLMSFVNTFSSKRDPFNDAAGAIFTNSLPTASRVGHSLRSLRHCSLAFTQMWAFLIFSPPIPLQNSDDEMCLRKILYDAVVLVEYSFLKPERMDQLSPKHVKSIIMARLLGTGEAIELNRKQKDQTKAIYYTNAFSGSSLPSLIIRLIRSEIGTEDKASEPSSSSPATLLRWILKIENGGIRIFDNNMSKTRAKLLLDSMTEGLEQPVLKDAKKKSDADLIFYIDNKGEEDEEEGDEKMNESVSAAFVSASHTMQSAEPEKRKRKGKDSEHKSRVKFLKYSLHENSGSREGRSSIADSDDSSSESEVENPSTDEE
ncbi:hypothetical protein RND71_012460 [Anisodus tanguticus]|uniref:Uncharacterized protein n=1 Tax=Anisodus tanguticus TaxID=243964 RepID=A0AAE1SDA5_9SOLA|nr:hypothetical protein RND71_012460 [Anisodus tanguticus]